MNDTLRRSGIGAPATPPKEANKSTQPPLTGRRSMLSMRQSFGASGLPSTPRRGSMTPTNAPALPTPTAASRYATTTSTSGIRKAKELEIGDEVIMNGTSLVGVLRHLGPVAFKPGEYAGLELIGSSAGKGKNDGSVQGVQYFACDPGNGIFCPAHKVSPLSTEAPREATARPQSAMSRPPSALARPPSAMSARSGRSSVALGEYRPPSTTPSARIRSNTLSRPPSTTPGRVPSRNAIVRPGSSLSSRQNDNASTSRLLPRKSIADGLADEESRRRAKTSAEEAAKAEGRITAGSRAHRFLHMNAKDLEENSQSKAAADVFGSEANGKKVSPIKAGRPSSPLKDSLLGPNRATIGTPSHKSRISNGAIGTMTPRIAKPRTSLFGAKAASSNGMLPPAMPSNVFSAIRVAPEDPSKGVSNRHSPATAVPVVHPKTPSRLSRAVLQRGESEEPAVVKDKNLLLLEELDLTPKRNSASFRSEEVHSVQPVEGRFDQGSDVDMAGFAITRNEEGEDEVVHATVPWALYQESTLETTRLKAELIEMTRQIQQSKADVERAKVKAQQEAQQEWEEEKKLQQEDEARRRKDLESKEKEARDQNTVLSRDVKRITDEAKRVEGEKDKTNRDTAERLKESEQLVESLKLTLDSGSAKSEEVNGRVQAKDLEMKQLHERINRLVEEKDKERTEYLREIDDLKSAGEEAFDIFQKEQALSNETIQETENKLIMLEARAQEAILEVERQRDEALQGIKPTSVAEIDHRSLQEQFSLAQKRIVALEDEVAEMGAVMQQERETAIRRKDRSAEIESRLKVDLAKLKSDYKRMNNSEAEARNRAEELMEALEESRAALENERAELEILRTEALVIGSSHDGQPMSEREKNRLESEVERLNGLLEGARSGKREISRQAEGHVKEIERLHILVEEVRSHLQNAESDRSSLEEKLSIQVHGTESDLRRSIETKTRQVEILQRTNLPLSDQVSALQDHHRKEMAEKEDELALLQRKMEDSTKNQYGSRYSLTVPSSSDSSLHSPTMSGFGDTTLMGTNSSPGNSRRFSNNSNQSRKSRNSQSQFPANNDTTMKEMAGLRSIVNTLNQELTEFKVSNMQKEEKLNAEVSKWKKEARKWQLTVESMSGSTVQDQSRDQNQTIESRLQVEKKLQEVQDQVHRYRDRLQAIESQKQEEINKLNQDIADLEALCEATVWRREEQDAKKQELERQVAKLQRSLDRALNGAKPEDTSSHDSILVKEGENGSTLVCDDCGESGHLMGDDCPYSKDDMLF